MHVVRKSDIEWRVLQTGRMRVPVIIYADAQLISGLEAKALTQAANVAELPGVVEAVYVMPDAHSGYGFPIGGVAAFDPDKGGVVSAGGVGYDIACGVRTLLTGVHVDEVLAQQKFLADRLFSRIPAGVGATGGVELNSREIEAMLYGGARWAVSSGYGLAEDLARIEDGGALSGADPEMVSALAKKRQEREVGTLGSGNHYLEVQEITQIFDANAADCYGLRVHDVVVSIHCGSRGLGHQIGTDYLDRMFRAASAHGLALPDKELACAPVHSELGQEYLGAMRAGINCALANRQVLTHLTREVFHELFPRSSLHLLYDVSHNTCKEEWHEAGGRRRRVFVHRKGATRAWGPGHPDLPAVFRPVGQPVFVGGSMGTASFILAGCGASHAFSSANHGAGRNLSRTQAKKRYHARDVLVELEARGIVIRATSLKGVAEEAPGAYKDVDAVVETAEAAGLARKVALLRPLICVKG